MEMSPSHRGSWKFGAAGPMRHEARNCSVSVISTSTQAPGTDLGHLLPQTSGSPEASPARSFWRQLPRQEAAFCLVLATSKEPGVRSRVPGGCSPAVPKWLSLKSSRRLGGTARGFALSTPPGGCTETAAGCAHLSHHPLINVWLLIRYRAQIPASRAGEGADVGLQLS